MFSDLQHIEKMLPSPDKIDKISASLKAFHLFVNWRNCSKPGANPAGMCRFFQVKGLLRPVPWKGNFIEALGDKIVQGVEIVSTGTGGIRKPGLLVLNWPALPTATQAGI